MMGTKSFSYHFGDFKLREREFSLVKAGEAVPIEHKAFRALLYLLRKPKILVPKEELLDAVWGDTAVADGALTRCIWHLRRVLGDDFNEPRYIETVAKVGYRFICEVIVSEDVHLTALGKSAPEMLPRAENGRAAEVAGKGEMWLKIAAGVLAVLTLSVGAAVAYRWFWDAGPPEKTSEKTHLNAMPFTALPGLETSPAFSPDGSRIAFAWNGDPVSGGKGFDLYVKAIGSETLLRLTQHPSEMIGSAWSPDGTQIAFHRMAGADSGIYVVPALGGPERKLHSTVVPFSIIVPIGWSPDGKWIAFTDIPPGEGKATMSLLSTETWEIKRLPGTPKCLVPGAPAFSPSGEYLAYNCFQTQEEFGLYTIPLGGGPPKLILLDSRFPQGLTWSDDGKSLIISAAGELDEVIVANASVKRLDLVANASWPTISSRANKFAFASWSGIPTILRKDLLHPESPAVKFASSTRWQLEAQFSPDGEHMAFRSDRSGIPGVWVSNVDGSDPVQISNPQVESDRPKWSPDGKKIAFDAWSVDGGEIFVADLSERIPRKLVTNISHLSWPTWSRDGKWLYFMSNEVGRTGIYRCPASGGDAVALSKNPYGAVAQESFDGQTVYFTDRDAYPVIRKVSLPVLPGTALEVDGLPRLRNGAVWTLSPGGIYFVPGEAPRSVRYFDFATRKVRTLFETDKDFVGDLSVSPDGRWISYAQVNEGNSDIMLVDHFQ
jgi:Tol biopolymer transport system component/DNA-binding winged helix-turn-helix (wHTH) protein